MPALAALFFLAAPPFWEAKLPRQWTDPELALLLHDSPWAQMAPPPKSSESPPEQIYVATAHPIRDAEMERMRRRALRLHTSDSGFDEYLEFLRDNAGQHIVLAAYVPDVNALADAEESHRMEQESIMKIGRKKYKMTGSFPPTPTDPYLRLVFPRVLQPSDKSVEFDLYIPGLSGPYREIEFAVKDMVYKGQSDF
ncbi:MAG TPA: hypothetical protein VKV15_24705 [Bryobacteraceae bacterium]|nr:hypothetical protein [Bryobacteraceae bacterium]